jgi:hypothetical protein
MLAQAFPLEPKCDGCLSAGQGVADPRDDAIPLTFLGGRVLIEIADRGGKTEGGRLPAEGILTEVEFRRRREGGFSEARPATEETDQGGKQC